MKLPGQLQAEYAVKGLWGAIAGVVFLAGIAGCTVQTVRIEGAQIKLPLVGRVGPEGWRPYAQRLEQTIDDLEDAQLEAERMAREAKQSEEDALKELAKERDDATEESLRSELARAREFIARNRVRPGNQCAASPATAATEDHGPGEHEEAGPAPELDANVAVLSEPEGGLVAVPARDIEICTTNTVLAEQWREWGVALEARAGE